VRANQKGSRKPVERKKKKIDDAVHQKNFSKKKRGRPLRSWKKESGGKIHVHPGARQKGKDYDLKKTDRENPRKLKKKKPPPSRGQREGGHEHMSLSMVTVKIIAIGPGKGPTQSPNS